MFLKKLLACKNVAFPRETFVFVLRWNKVEGITIFLCFYLSESKRFASESSFPGELNPFTREQWNVIFHPISYFFHHHVPLTAPYHFGFFQISSSKREAQNSQRNTGMDHTLSSQHQTTNLNHCPNATQITVLKVSVREWDPFSLLEGTDVSPRLSMKRCAYVELEEDNRKEQILSY